MTTTTTGFFYLLFVAVISLSKFIFVVKAQQTNNNINEGRFQALIKKLEDDVKEFGKHLESLHETRCEKSVRLETCSQGNHHDCQSIFPNPTCLGGESYQISTCGNGSIPENKCSGLYDFSVSNVRIPSELALGEFGNPTDKQVIETICYTQPMDEFLQAKRDADKSYWENIGVEPRAWYFGSSVGSFRIWPARPGDECGRYDPRIRPWYVAASSGPKNVIMVLDTSGSMLGLRMELLKEAAKRVVDTLTVSDRIAIVPFATVAGPPIVDQYGNTFVATKDNKQLLKDAIDKLEAIGSTNIYDAFTQTFDVLEKSARDEFTVDCNTAILFLTDGELDSTNATTNDVLDLVRQRMLRTRQVLSKPIVLFTFSVSDRQQVHELPSKLACSTEYGLWSKVTTDEGIVNSLSSYYRLFALRLGEDQNEEFAAWVEPYVFATGDILGTTVSVPVYDRTKNPNLFLGVAAVDISITALDSALGITATTPGMGSAESIERISRVAYATAANCPVLDLGLCALESVRRQGLAGDDALCTRNCTLDDFVQVEEGLCPFVTDYPSDLWVNRASDGVPYIERACCIVGETIPSDQCPVQKEAPRLEEGNNSTFPIGGIVGIVVGALVILGGIVWWCMAPVDDEDEPEPPRIVPSSKDVNVVVKEPEKSATRVDEGSDP